jgi:hypothetical protein
MVKLLPKVTPLKMSKNISVFKLKKLFAHCLRKSNERKQGKKGNTHIHLDLKL